MPHGRQASRGLSISCSRARPQSRIAPHDRRITVHRMSKHSTYTGRYTRSGYQASPFSDDEIATVRTMRAAGCGLKSIAAALGRSKSGVARYIPPDAHDGWDTAPPTRTPSDDASLYARWEARMPAMREAIKDDVKRS
jgi:hypothetical protein